MSTDRYTVRRPGERLEDRRERVIKHLCQTCGMSEREAKTIVGRAKGHASLRPALSEEGLDVYQSAVSREMQNPVLRTILLLLPLTGLRINEACTLTWDRIIEHEGRPALYVMGKNSEERRVALTDKAAGLIDRYIDEMERTGRGRRLDGAWVFPAGTGPNHVDTGRVQRAVRLIRRRHPRLQNITPHVLRHTYASLALGRCQDLKAMRENLGHKSKKTTLLYYHVDDE